MASNIYTFVDFNSVLTEVAAGQLNFVGTWSNALTYYRFDVVTYGNTQFVCTQQNKGQTPPLTLQFNSFWSVLAFTSVGTSSGTGGTGGGVTSINGATGDITLEAGANITIIQNGQEFTISSSGTNSGGFVPSWVMSWIGQTFNIAVAGTNTANQALALATTGTNIADSALTLAVAGTNAADQAYLLAQLAYNLAIRGTYVAANLIDSIVTDTGASDTVFDAIVTDSSGNVVVNSSGNVVADETGKIASVVINSAGNVVAKIIP